MNESREPKLARRVDTRHRTTLGNRLRMLTRVLGMLGLLALPVGFLLARLALPPFDEWSSEKLQPLVEGAAGLATQIGTIAMLVGAAFVLIALCVEIFGVLFLTSGNKTVVGTNAALQIALAIALLVVVNAIGFKHYYRFDKTRDHRFTIEPELKEQLGTLRSDSAITVVVLQLHKTAGRLSEKGDAYDKAAEKKVVEKVTDLIAQLRELGPRFNVVVIDVEEEGSERTVKDLTVNRPGLADAIASAPENSIFFYADAKVRPMPKADADRLSGGGIHLLTSPDPADAARVLAYPGSVARMSFSEFYQLDKTSGREATPRERDGLSTLIGGPAYAPGVRGKGNLVLLPRGNAAFVRRLLALEERRPRVGIAVIHPLLSTRENFEEYTSGGLRRTLEANGYDVTDIILKKWGNGPPTPAASTFEESELDRTENRYNSLAQSVADLDRGLPQLVAAKEVAVKLITEADAANTNEAKVRLFSLAARELQKHVVGRIQTDEQLRAVARQLDRRIPQLQQELKDDRDALEKLEPKYRDMLKDDRTAENRRIADVKAKMKQYVAECDLLIVPRLTVIDISRGEQGIIPPSLFNLSKDQAEVVKEFLVAGKPVLFAVGPTNIDRRGSGERDDVEALLPPLGIIPGRQTVLTDSELVAITERQNEAFGVSVEVPALTFDLTPADKKAANPVGNAFRITARAVDSKLDVKKSGYRPLYPSDAVKQRSPFDPIIATTGTDSFNKDRPLAEDDYLPKFDPKKQDEAKIGTRDEERRGPFPVALAVETRVPVEWLDPEGISPKANPAAALAGPAGVYSTSPPGYGVLMAASAISLPFDGGLMAALVTLAAQQEKVKTVRVVAIGHGGLFTGKKLDPGSETLLLHSCNWLLKRDDRLPADLPEAARWHYPRSDVSAPGIVLWWALAAGLPVLAVCFGLLAFIVRKVR